MIKIPNGVIKFRVALFRKKNIYIYEKRDNNLYCSFINIKTYRREIVDYSIHNEASLHLYKVLVCMFVGIYLLILASS